MIGLVKTFFFNRLVIAAVSGAGSLVLTKFSDYHDAFCSVVLQ